MWEHHQNVEMTHNSLPNYYRITVIWFDGTLHVNAMTLFDRETLSSFQCLYEINMHYFKQGRLQER